MPPSMPISRLNLRYHRWRVKYRKFLVWAADALWLARPRVYANAYRCPPTDPIKVVCLSNTHNLRPEIPPGDLLLHAGDLSVRGSFEEVQAQLDWLAAQPHKHKVVIAGNHDLVLDRVFMGKNWWHKQQRGEGTADDLNFHDINYLYESDITLDFNEGRRKLKIYGSPWTPYCGTWAFQYAPIVDRWKEKVPLDTDITLTHGPPRGYLDKNRGGKGGCQSFAMELARVRPRLAVFGHLPDGYGRCNVQFDPINSDYEYIKGGRGGIVHLFILLMGRILEELWVFFLPTILLRWVKGRRAPTTMVNAALTEDKGSTAQAPIVVDI